MKIETLSLNALRPRPNNPRTHSPKQIQQLADSIERFGWTNPILIDASNFIIAGHGRWMAARKLGLESAPVIRNTNMSAAEIRAYVIADNKLAQNAGWDDDLLRIELGELMEMDLDFSIEITGFETPEIDIIMDDGEYEHAPEIAEEPSPGPAVSQPGDLWLLGPHRLYCGDALDEASYQAVLADRKAATIFTDPPYNLKVSEIVNKGRKKHREFAMASGEMEPGEFAAFLNSAFKLMASSCVPGAIAFVCMDWRHAEELLAAGKQQFDELKNICVWDKGVGGMGSLYRSQHELVFIYKVSAGKHVNNIQLGRYGRNRTNLWRYPGVQSRRKDLQLHPTVKPISMVADALRDVTKRNDVVLDPFLGSGTTLLAAERTERIFCGIELDPAYVDLVVERFERETGTSAIHATSGETFRQRDAQSRRSA